MANKQDIAKLRSLIAQIENHGAKQEMTGLDEGPSHCVSDFSFDNVSSGRLEDDAFGQYAFVSDQKYSGFDKNPDIDDQAESTPKKQKANAFERIVSMTAKRFRSECDIRARLAREQYPQDQIDEAVERAVSCLLIDDARYADVMIRSRIRTGKGRQGIEAELRRDHIDPDSLVGWPYDYFPDESESELDRAVKYLMQHPTRSKNPRQSAYRKLVQKGYSSSVASSASRIWCEGR